MHEKAIELILKFAWSWHVPQETKLSEQFYKEPDITEEEAPQERRSNPG
jgi:hypothetical protein